MPRITSRTIPEDAHVRTLDPALVAAALAANANGQETIRVPVLLRSSPAKARSALEALLAAGAAEIGYAITSEGQIAALQRAADRSAPVFDIDIFDPDAKWSVFLPLVLSLPSLNEGQISTAPAGDAPRRSLGDSQALGDPWPFLLDPDTRVEYAAKVYPALDFSVPAIHARPEDLPPPTRDGRGVIVGVVDWGCDFHHPAFRDAGGTRLKSLWDQNGVVPSGGLGLGHHPPGTLSGVVFGAGDLNRALSAPDPYWAAGYDPAANSWLPDPAPDGPVHGTHVLGTAAGSAARPPDLCGDRNAAGVAPAAELMFVHLRPDALDPLKAANTADVIQAAASIFDAAAQQDRPCVVNLSMGNNTGPHDGSSLVEQQLDALAKAPGRAIVVPAGNNRTQRLHASGTVWTGSPRTIRWTFPATKRTNGVNIWYETTAPDPILEVTLTAPDGTTHAQSQPTDAIILLEDGAFAGTLLVATAPAGGKFLQQIAIRITPSGTAETWTLALSTSAGPVAFHAWIERADGGQSAFAEPDADPTGTLDSLSCGNETLCIGAYYEIPGGQPAAFFSAEGPTRDGRNKPDVAAPGYAVQAPLAKGGLLRAPGQPGRIPLRVAMTGTSVSVAHAAGLAALLLQTHPLATADQLRLWIASNTQLLPPTAPAAAPPGQVPRQWHAQLGYGRIDAAATVSAAP